MRKKVIKIYLIFIFCIQFLKLLHSQDINREICITVDDLPYITKYFKDIKTGQYITDRLLTAFRKYGVTALGSVNSGKLITNGNPDSEKINILNKWLDSEMTLANHTYAHKNYNRLFFSEFKNDITDGEMYLKDILKGKNKELKYFRHPHLYRGETKEKADSLQSFLDSLGYIIAPVSIDNSDYIFSWAYEKALSLNNDSLAKRIGTDYISYMGEVLDYYESQSINLLGYNIKHTLLTHANLLNANFIEELLAMYISKGYKFISIEEALEDRSYTELKDEFYKKSGISWLHRWAYTMGKRGDFFKGEPEVPVYISEFIK
ncbi:MAG: polysaccharide deacetylase family protein [Ignavibacteriae bacterium]|nr:polysaccharide deacetylase family protein [Ignavibacteriota bacterium]